MKKLYTVLALVAVTLLSGCSFGTIETGNVGVQTSFGNVNPQEKQAGAYFAFFSNVDEFTAKEVGVTLTNMTPKAKDNLSLKDYDVTVYYRADANKIADFRAKYANQSSADETGLGLPGFLLVRNEATDVAQKQVSLFDSLEMHLHRDEIAAGIKTALQERLNSADAGTFTVSRVVINNIVTDSAIEDSIRKAVQENKNLEAMEAKLEIAKKQAELNEKLNQTYTPEYLQHEYNEALRKCAENTNCTMYVGIAPSTAVSLRR